MSQMIRKQIYLEKKQEVNLKRLAHSQGVSEAEVIRQAIDEKVSSPRQLMLPADPLAWEKALHFMKKLQRQGSRKARSRPWNREEAYQDRLSRYERRSR